MKQSIDMEALARGLPVSGLEPNPLTVIDGLVLPTGQYQPNATICLLEPPASQRVPYVNAVDMLQTLLLSQGLAAEHAKAIAIDIAAQAKAQIEDEHWVPFFEFSESDVTESLPLTRFSKWLRAEIQMKSCKSSERLSFPLTMLDFLEHVAERVIGTVEFWGPDNWEVGWTLENAPSHTPPTAMIQFIPAPPWEDHEIGNWEDDANHPFRVWRDSIKPVAENLEKVLGESVYYFKRIGDDLDDDTVHRFLVMHWCCTTNPSSPFVQYLLKTSKANDIDDLKAALIDPRNYTQPFKMHGALSGTEARFSRVTYTHPSTS